MQSAFPPPDYHGYADYHDHYDNFEEDNHIPLPAEPKTHVNFDDPEIAALPRILLMGPRRSGKTSIQVRKQKGVLGYVLLSTQTVRSPPPTESRLS